MFAARRKTEIFWTSEDIWRFLTITGRQATLEGDGRTFAEVQAERVVGNGAAFRAATRRLVIGWNGFVVPPAPCTRANIQCVGDLVEAAHARASSPAAEIAG